MSIKFFLFFGLIHVTTPPLYNDDLKCKEFRTGRFTLTDKNIDGKYIIERNDSLQIETDLNSGYTSKFSVTWVNDCEYQLSILEGRDDIMNFYRGKKLTIKIIETYKDSYKFEGSLEGLDHRPTQIVKRIK